MIPIIFTTRFSVFSTLDEPLWRTQKRKDVDSYRTSLFDPLRLSVHLHLFKILTIPSLCAQFTGPDDPIALHVFTSTELPEPTRSALRQMLEVHPWASLVEVAPDEPIPHEKYIAHSLKTFDANGAYYAHCRLDDDDALANDFVCRLRYYVCKHYLHYYVSLGSGYNAVYDSATDSFLGIYARNYSKIGLGLAKIGYFKPKMPDHPIVNAYIPESHTRCDRFSPTIVDSTAPAWIRTIHSHQDSIQNSLRNLGTAADPAHIADLFAAPKTMLPTIDQSESYMRSLPVDAGWSEELAGDDPGYDRLLARLRKLGTERDRALRQLEKERARTLRQLEKERARTRQATAALRSEIDWLREEHTAIRKSIAWKIIKPLRKIESLLLRRHIWAV